MNRLLYQYYIAFSLIGLSAIVSSCRQNDKFLTLDRCISNMEQLSNLDIHRMECVDFWDFERNDYKIISTDSNYYEFNTVQGLLLKTDDSLRLHKFSNAEISRQVRFIIDSLKIVSLSSDPVMKISKAEFLMSNINVKQLWKICFNEKSNETIDNLTGQIQYGCAVNRFSKYLYVTSDRSQVNRNCYRFFKYRNYYFQICGIDVDDLDKG
ncbi:MAG: hypothetical protein HOP11_02035 [Saprospiraceae bacterium]|nr:hypothetical protein [Saprospiraceae bacterium]